MSLDYFYKTKDLYTKKSNQNVLAYVYKEADVKPEFCFTKMLRLTYGSIWKKKNVYKAKMLIG